MTRYLRRLEWIGRKKMVFKIKSEKRGGHIHVRVFSAPEVDKTFSLNGTVVFLEEEWKDFSAALYLGSRLSKSRFKFSGDKIPTYLGVANV